VADRALTVSLDDVRAAAGRLEGVAVRTPLLRLPLGDDLYVKPESLQRTGSFKFRGAYNALSSTPREQLANGVVADSSGNHAQGVAAAAALLGVSATIVMPDNAAPGNQPSPMLKVVTPSGKTGFVPAEALSPLGSDQLCFTKEGGNWKISGFIGGDQ